ncbi:PIN domain-containing protein [bacterium]|nr:PIN domain-containing protein [bacterium]
MVCFDTHVIIWGIKREATAGQEGKIAQAESLISSCEENKINIMIPSIVFAEVICNLDSKLQNELSAVMTRRFIIPPFDTRAALYFAQMWKEAWGRRKGLDENIRVSREHMKADLMIIATARSNGAYCIYSEDASLKLFACDYIDVKPLPAVAG